MLIVCNGAYKSGSTWIFDIIRKITNFTPIPIEYKNKNWNNANIEENMLPEFLKNVDYQSSNYIFKSHYRSDFVKNLLKNKENIFVFNITRDLRDVAVSAYYHEKRHKNYSGTFEEYYFEIGITRINGVKNYHEFWNHDLDNIMVLNYEKMKSNLDEEIRKIANYLSVNISDSAIKEISEDNEFSNKKSNNPKNQHLRKGVAGDYKNHFTDKVTEHFNTHFNK